MSGFKLINTDVMPQYWITPLITALLCNFLLIHGIAIGHSGLIIGSTLLILIFCGITIIAFNATWELHKERIKEQEPLNVEVLNIKYTLQ